MTSNKLDSSFFLNSEETYFLWNRKLPFFALTKLIIPLRSILQFCDLSHKEIVKTIFL